MGLSRESVIVEQNCTIHSNEINSRGTETFSLSSDRAVDDFPFSISSFLGCITDTCTHISGERRDPLFSVSVVLRSRSEERAS